MGIREFWDFLQEVSARYPYSKPVFLQEVKKQILNKLGVVFVKEEEDEFKKFFLNVIDDLKKESGVSSSEEDQANQASEVLAKLDFYSEIKKKKIKIKAWKIKTAKRHPFYEKLKKWGQGIGAEEPAILVYYWFHAYDQSSPHAERIDKNLFNKSIKELDGFDESILPSPEKIIDITKPPEETETKLTIHQIRKNNKLPQEFTAEDWFNPNNPKNLPFFGRADKLKLLNDFAKDERPFLMWAIAGPSGAGKTSLYRAWMQGRYADFKEPSAVNNSEWEQKVLSLDDKPDWQEWSGKNILLIVDYTYGFSAVIKDIVKHCEKGLKDKKVRLLFVDHVLKSMKDLKKDIDLGLSNQENLDKSFYKDTPLQLEGEDHDDIIERILWAFVGDTSEGAVIENAKKYLKETLTNARHPMFAVLVGDAIKNNKPFDSLSRRGLIEHYLSGSKRLPWQPRVSSGNPGRQSKIEGKIASAFVAASTARRGIDLGLLRNCISKEEEKQLNAEHKSVNEIILTCKRILSVESVKPILPPLEPDIIGETFFLLFIKDWLEFARTDFRASFIDMLSNGNEDIQVEDALQFVSFIKRLVTNLSNDVQNDPDIKELWDAFFEFMQPGQFPKNSKMCWAISAALIEVVELLKESHSEKSESILGKEIINYTYGKSHPKLLQSSLLAAMKHFEHTSTLNPEHFQRLDALGKLYEKCEVNTENITALMLAIEYSYEKVIDNLVKYGCNLNATDKYGANALMWSIWCDDEKVVFYLLSIWTSNGLMKF